MSRNCHCQACIVNRQSSVEFKVCLTRIRSHLCRPQIFLLAILWRADNRDDNNKSVLGMPLLAPNLKRASAVQRREESWFISTKPRGPEIVYIQPIFRNCDCKSEPGHDSRFTIHNSRLLRELQHIMAARFVHAHESLESRISEPSHRLSARPGPV